MADESYQPSRRSLLMGMSMGAALAVVGDGGSIAAFGQATGKRALPRTSPEAAGISPDSIADFVDAVNEKLGGLHSFMIIRHGEVATEGWWAPYGPTLPHMLYSLSKSFTSTAVGLAVADGKLSVEDLVLSFFPDKAPANPDANLASMRVRHLLTMSTGHDKDATGPTTAAKDGDWIRAFLSLPVEHEPGSKFVYNSAATYMLSAIVQKLTGTPVLAFLTPRLFQPLGISSPTWETCPRGMNCGGWGLSVRTEDIARFGQLYLQKGKWNGKPLVPEAWVSEATTRHISNGDGGASDWAQGYGYQFWRCRHGAFRGDGAFGQYCIVMPDQDAVIAITSGLGDMQAVLNAVWDHLLPGFSTASASSSSDSRLRKTIRGLTVPPPPGNPSSSTASRVSGRRFRFDDNTDRIESGTLVFDSHGCSLTLKGPDGEQTIMAGTEKWAQGSLPRRSGPSGLGGRPAGRIAARGAWSAEDTYTVKVCFNETPYIETITCRFTGDTLAITRKLNVAFGPTEFPPLHGSAA